LKELSLCQSMFKHWTICCTKLRPHRAAGSDASRAARRWR
jgi:hypothetical protein